MHICRIRVENFRNLADVEIAGLGPSVVVVGENGAGKSNLLHALRLVLDPALSEAARQLTADDFWDGLDQPFAGAVIRVEVDLTAFDDDIDAKALLGDYLVERDPHVARLTYLYRPSATAPPESSADSDYEVVVFGGNDEVHRIGRDLWRHVSVRVLPALRDAEGDLAAARSPIRRLVSRAHVPPDVLEKAAEDIDTAADSLISHNEIDSIRERIDTQFRDLVGPRFSLPTSLGVTPSQPQQLLRAIRLFVDGDRRRAISQSSLGQANLLYLAVLLEEITQQISHGEAVRVLLGVEEPEAHLHPQVQRVLFRRLLRDGAAVWVTTHSPHVASVSPLESLVLLRSVGDEVRAFRAEGLDLSDIERADIERYLDVTRGEMLFAGAIMLVEGIAERYLVPAFASARNIDLDAHGVTVCSVEGTDFRPYRRVLGPRGFNIPTFVITDGDPTPTGGWQGLRRGASLLRAKRTRESVRERLDNGDFAGARAKLSRFKIFVGDRTLELDMLPQADDAFKTAFGELVPSSLRRKRFDRHVDAASRGSKPAAKAVLSRIEAVGKGRFAQRLADHVAAVDPPAHIAAALDALAEHLEIP